MATATTPLNATASPPGYDQFVDSRIAKTRTAVKSADLATGAVVLLAWALVVVIVAAIADHWLVAGGLDRWERYSLWGVGLAGAGLYTATRLGPNLLRSVNPLYAAREIERETPELKNSLLNLLQLRGAAESPSVKQALERQAAERLAKAGDAPIDHTPLVRAAKLLLALVALVGVYVVASPKDFFASAGRVLAPWSEIAAPTRVRITAIEPGAVTLAQGERLNVAAMVSGLGADELVELVYTTDDRQAVGRRVPMTATRGGLQFSGSLPAGSGAVTALGVQGSLTYRIEAGDAHSPNFHVEVLTAPTIAPVMVRYEYPPYTGLKPREVEGVGDLKAVDGTRATLSVQANLPIESAQVDVGSDGRPDVRMTADGKGATGTLLLRHDGPGATTTNNYVLRFTSTDGQANHDPPQYQIEVVGDLAPEASIREPEAESVDVALTQRVRVAVEARDPDYALKRVRLVGEAAGKRVLDKDLLKGDGRGRFRAETELTPQAIGLRPGDVLDYWVEATDNRTPQPNVSQSPRHQLRVQGAGNQQQGDHQPGDRRDREQQPGEGGDPRQDQQQGQQDQQQGQPGGKNAEGRPGEQQQDGDAPGQPNQAQPNPAQPNQAQPNQDQKGEQQQPGEAGENGQQGGQAKSQAREEAGDQERQQGENGQPPPGGMTGPGNEGGANSENKSDAGNEGSSSSKPNDGANSSAGGSQPGQPNQGQRGEQQQQPSGGQSGGDQSSGQQPTGDQQTPPSDDNSSTGQGAGENPVARDGTDDGSAFDKMLDWMKQQQGGKPSPSNQSNQDGGESGEAGQEAQQNGGKQSEGDSPSQGSQGRGEESRQGQSKEQQGQSKKQLDQSGEGSDASTSEAEGGEQGAGEAEPKQDIEGASNGRQGERGQQGRGGADGKPQSRDQQGGQQPDRNEQGPGAGEQDRSGQQSNSQSSQSGGDTPPGESTERDAGPREGADGAGQSQAADRGAGQSADKGAGDTSGREGGEQASDSSTGGDSGDERGKGNNSRESESGEGGRNGLGGKQQGDKQRGKQPDGQPQEDPSGQAPAGGKGESGQQPGRDSQESGGSDSESDQQNSLDDQRGQGARDSKSPAGRGGPMELGDRGATSDAAGAGAESGGDAANLDYAREQTELVLKRLEEQLSKKEVDRKLLDKLGWTDEDLREFVDRWQARRQQAAERGAEGEAELDRALRSLGLSPKGPTATNKVTDDSFRDLREGARAKTPPRLRDSVEWYLRSINAADDTPASQE